MGIVFVKSGNKVKMTKDGALAAGISVDASVIADPEKEDFIMITSRIDQTQNDAAIRVNWKDVTNPEVVSREDLIDQLTDDFFFRVTDSVDLGTFRLIVSGAALNVDKKVAGEWVTINAFE